jgi:mannosyltransferase
MVPRIPFTFTTYRGRVRLWVVPVAAGLVAAVVSSIGIDVPSVWYDEAATVSGATRSLPQLLALLANVDAVHGAYYLLVHAVFGAVGYSPLSLRLVSAIAVGIAAAVVVLLDRRLRPGSLGIAAGLVFGILPRVVWMGGEGRSYAVASAFAALLTLLVLRAMEADSRGRWVLYSVVTGIGCVFFVYLALVVAAHGVTVALLRRRMLVPWSIAAATAALASTPFLPLVMGQGGQLPPMPQLGIDTVHTVLVAQWFGSAVMLAALSWALVIVGLRHSPRVLGPALLLPTAALLAAALVTPELYQPRYLAMCTPFLALAMAGGLAAIPWRAARAAGLVVVMGLAVPPLIEARAIDAKKDAGWSTIASIVEGARSDEPAAVVYGKLFPHHGTTARAISVAYPGAFEGMLDVTLGIPAAEYPDDLWGTWRPLEASLGRLDSIDELFLVTTSPDADDSVLRGADWTPTRSWHEGGVTVVQYERG